MNKIQHKVGFIGAGNMGEAMIGSMIRSGVSDPAQIFIHELRSEQAEALKTKYGINVLSDNSEIVKICDVIIFAVKPQSLDEVLSEAAKKNIFHEITGRKLIVSIAAGKKMAKFEEYIYSTLDDQKKSQIPILRVMPNTPALVGEGMSGLCANSYADSKDIETVKTILLSMGKVVECEEKDMDAITAISGSGPAYCFYIVEAMIEAGLKLGFSAEIASELTITTLRGAIALLETQSTTAEELRRKVTSPGGTTEAAIKVLEKQDVKSSIINAVQAAALRSKELSA